MEYVTCNLCGSIIPTLFRKKDKLGTVRIEFHVVECLGCGLLYVNPRPDQGEIGRFYPRSILEEDAESRLLIDKMDKAVRKFLSIPFIKE
jgi:hypothetical protein